MEEAVHAAANSIAGLESGSVDGKEMLTVPGTQIQSDETEEFDAILHLQKPDCKSLLEQLKEDLPETEITYSYGYSIAGNDLSHIEEALEACNGSDLILMTLGGKHGSCSVASMGEGVDATDINLPVCQEVLLSGPQNWEFRWWVYILTADRFLPMWQMSIWMRFWKHGIRLRWERRQYRQFFGEHLILPGKCRSQRREMPDRFRFL